MTSWSRFVEELRRRRVFRVAAAYAACAFVAWQAADIAFPALDLPGWAVTFVVVASLLGFPLALVLAWIFDVTSEGVVRTSPAGGQPSEQAQAQGRAAQVVVLARGSWRAGALALGAGGTVLVLAAAGVPTSGWGGASEGVVPSARSEAPDRSLVVIPFRNLSTDPEDAFFGEGIGEVRTGRQLWGERHDRELVGVFDVQSEIALEIVRDLEVRLLPGVRARIERPLTTDLVAWELHPEARDRQESRLAVAPEEIETHVEHTRALLREALGRDPGFAAAWAPLSGTCFPLTRTPTAAELASALDPWSAPRQRQEGDVLLRLGLLDEAQAAFERAVELASAVWFFHAELVGAHLQRGDVAAVRAGLERLEAVAPMEADPGAEGPDAGFGFHYRRGMIAGLRDDVEAAVEALIQVTPAIMLAVLVERDPLPDAVARDPGVRRLLSDAEAERARQRSRVLASEDGSALRRIDAP
jgi:adenylate cyclase